MITDEELENLPNDPQQAFVQLERIVRNKLHKSLDNANDGYSINEFRLSYMSTILGAAKSYNINILEGWNLPSRSDDISDLYTNFISDVDHATIQLRIQNSRDTRQFSVALDSAAKNKIHHFIEKIRLIVEKADLEEHKKNSLYDRLNKFADEVDKSRTGWQRGMDVGVAISAAIGKGIENLKPAQEWFDKILGVMGDAKDSEEILSISYKEAKRISPPHKQISASKKADDVDDEIPF